MISYKNECKDLLKRKAKIYIVDFDGDKFCVFTRTVVGIFGDKNGRDSYWGVKFNEPMPNNCTGAIYSNIHLDKADAEVESK